MNIAYVAFKNLARKATRTWLLLSIVAVVSCTLFAATLFLKSTHNALELGTYRLGADVIVVPAEAEKSARAALLSGEATQFLMGRDVLDKVRRVEGVKSATPQLFIKPTTFSCCYNVDVFLVAFEPQTDLTVKPWLERHLSRPLAQNEAITGREIPVNVGDTIRFFGTTFRVAGTMDPTGMDFFDRSAFMTMDAAYRMAEESRTKAIRPVELGRDRISIVLVSVADDYTPDRVALRLENEIGGVRALVSDKVISTVRRQLGGLVNALIVLSVVLWLIVLLIMGFAFYMIVNERRRELGLLRAMGATRRHLGSLILGEASLVSSAGGAAGVVLGFALLAGFKGLVLQRLRLPYLFPSAPELALLVAVALAGSLLTGVLSAALPALSVMRAQPYDAIRSSE